MSLRWSSLRSLEVSLSRALTPLVGEFSCLRLERSGGISPLPLPLQPAALLRTSAGVAALNISNQQQQEKLEEVKRSVMRALKCQVPDTMLPQVKYLISIGVRIDDLSKLSIREMTAPRTSSFRKVLHRPELIKAKVGFWRQQFEDIDGSTIGKMIIRSVNSLFILHESKLKERLAVLYSHGLDKHTVFKFLPKSASVFSMKLDTLETKIESLKAILAPFETNSEDSNAVLLKLLSKRPSVLTRKPEKIEEVLGVLTKHGYSAEEVAIMIVKNPNILSYDRRRVEEKFDFLKDLQDFQDEAEIRSFFFSSPKVFDLSSVNIRETFNFLRKFNSVSRITKFPQCLSYSLEKRIKPRYMILNNMNSDVDSFSNWLWLSMSTEDFERKYCK